MGNRDKPSTGQTTEPATPVDQVSPLAQPADESARSGRAPDERLRFAMLVTELASSFINVPLAEIDAAIESALERLASFLGFDRATLMQRLEERWLVTHAGAAGEFEPMEQYDVEKELPWLVKTILESKDVFHFSRIDQLPSEAEKEKRFFREHGPLSLVVAPMIAGGEIIGSVAFGSLRRERELPLMLVKRTLAVGMVFANALTRQRTEGSLQEALTEITKLKDQLQAEAWFLREEIEVNFQHKDIIGHSRALKKILSQIEQVAITGSTVLLAGETGTGKELLARAIHNLSSCKNRAMLKVNCAALPAALMESELFGREKGAYTGAHTSQMGRFEVAHGSTIFLDEVSELPLELQAKLLRVLQEGQFERLGSTRTITADVRVIAATNRDLAKAVREGTFREDLYYRLNVFPIQVPPLRQRSEDIPLLVWAFVKEFEQTMDKTIRRIPQESMVALQRYPWPGNVRELRNVVERALILCKGSTLRFDLPRPGETTLRAFEPLTLRELESRHIRDVLKQTGWRVRGKGGAAEVLGLKPTTLDARIKKLNIPRRPGVSNIS